MNVHEFNCQLHGDDHKPDSTRIRTSTYLFLHQGGQCSLNVMAHEFQFTSHYGPAMEEPCTAKHVRGALQWTIRRLKYYDMPFKVKDYGNDVVALIPTNSRS